MNHTDTWTNRTEAERYNRRLCRRCKRELVPGVDTKQFCREHQDQQNKFNREYAMRKKAATP